MSLRYLITGISGFVGGHYLEYLSRVRPEALVFGMDLHAPALEFLPKDFRDAVRFFPVQLLDRNAVADVLREVRPDRIVHLASFSSVAFSWREPVAAFMNNTNIFLNVVEAVRAAGTRPRVLSVGSSEVYGVVREKDLPLAEGAPLRPVSPYAVARLSQEMLSRIYTESYGLPVICTRSFNHIGPRQHETFVVSSFAKQVAEAKRGLRKEIVCGDLDIVRDLTDVRDVVRAYDLLLDRGRAGEVYNICSGKGHRLSEVLAMLMKAAGVECPVRRDPSLIRPADNPVIVGDPRKVREELGFGPEHELHATIREMLRERDIL